MEKQLFQEAVDFLYDIPRFTTKNSQSHTKEFLSLLGSPQDSFQTIHVAGSNGKGSVCKFLFEMLKLTGKKVGLFTSPHLVDIRERFLISGSEETSTIQNKMQEQYEDAKKSNVNVQDAQMVSVEEFLTAYEIVKRAAKLQEKNSGAYPTFFEFIFAMGMVLFQRAGVEICVLETGLGGRLDATNTVTAPMLTVITSISLEHTEYLGDTIGAIASEKAGIIKAGAPVIFDANEPEASVVIEDRAKALQSPFLGISKNMLQILEIKRNFIEFSMSTRYDNDTRWQIPFSAEYQAMNASLAITAMRYLLEQKLVSLKACQGLSEVSQEDAKQTQALCQVVASTRWAGRMEEVETDVFFDGAHNLSGVTEFVKTARELTREDASRPILLFSMVKEKDYCHAIECLVTGVEWAEVLVATIPNQRGIPAEELKQIFADHDRSVEAIDDYKKAYDRAYSMKKEGQKVFCTGSLYFIGALKEYRLERKDTQ